MVKGKKNTNYGYKKNWTKAKFYKAITNYHKVKLTYSNRIELKLGGIQFVPQNNNVITISSIMADCPDWSVYTKLFLSYKLLAIGISATPTPVFSDAIAVQTQTGQFPVNKTYITSAPVLGIISATDGTEYKDIAESDKSMVLNFYTPIKRYWKMSPVEWDCSNAPNEQTYRLATNVHGLPINGSLFWNVTVNFYIIYKVKV